jgi:Domain of unknown function (DUF6265)
MTSHRTCSAVVPLVFLALSTFAFTQQPTGAGTHSAQPQDQPAVAPTPGTPQSPILNTDFAWLAGRWQGAWGPRTAQQVWTAPQAGVMLGTFQLVENDKTLVLELFTVVEDETGVKLRLRHFTPSLVAWEKSGPAVLNLVTGNPNGLVFENPVDGQPKRIALMRVDANTYTSRSEVLPEEGDLQVTEITYHRVSDGPPPRQHTKKPH